MKNIAKIVGLNENIEEEAVVKIGDVEFVAFIAYTPYPVKISQQYLVEISFFVDEIDIKENIKKEKGIIRKGETFGYVVNGYLDNKGRLNIGFQVEDDIFKNYQYLYGKYVTLKVDRIDLEVL